MDARRYLLLTRPQAQSQDFAAALERACPGRFAPAIAPLMRMEPVGTLPDLEGAQALVFTSANGVAQFTARAGDAARALPAFCVGAMTAEAARRAGFACRSADGDVGALAALVIAAHRPGGGDFVHVRGRHAAGDLVALLAEAGVPARGAEIYDQLPCALPEPVRVALARGGIEVLAFFSPRTAAIFAERALDAGWPLAAVTTLALSAAADAPLDGLGAGRRAVAAEPTRAAMIAALAAL